MNAAVSGGAAPPGHRGLEVWTDLIPNVPSDSERALTQATDFCPFVHLVPSEILPLSHVFC